MQNLTEAQVPLEDVEIIPRRDVAAATQAIGGTRPQGVLERARQIERSLYKVVGALVAPEIQRLGPELTTAYSPFDVIEFIRVPGYIPGAMEHQDFIPLVMLDDAHSLHPVQFDNLQHWLARRELRMGRWLLTRLDVFAPNQALATVTDEPGHKRQSPGWSASRELTVIPLQSPGSERPEARKAFRNMAKDMANRYLRHMPLFGSRNLTSLGDLLSSEGSGLTAGECKDLRATLDATQERLRISNGRREHLLAQVEKYRPGGQALPEDIRLAMLRVLMHRYYGRTPQPSLFDGSTDPEPSRPLAIDSDLYDAARLHLFRQFDRPYYQGMDDLCDSASENAERFLQLAAVLA
jgi:hypothetical protein